MMTIAVCETPFDPTEEMSAFTARTKGAGGVVSFLGAVRDMSDEGAVQFLQLEHYPGVTERSIAEIAEKAQARWALIDLLVIHRVGRMAPGEPIVLVATAAAHRRDAFEAADFLMDYLKTEAVFWKKEITDTAERWIEPRGDDYRDAARWKEET